MRDTGGKLWYHKENTWEVPMRKTILFLTLALLLTGCEKTAPAPAVEDQLSVLAEKFNTLESEIDWLPYVGSATTCAVTDLNDNGLLELVVTSVQGTGHFSTTYYYEVNEGGTDVTVWESAEDEFFSEPDLLKEFNVLMYLDADGIRHYILSDYLRNGAAESVVSLYSVVYKSGRIEYTYLAGKCERYNEETRNFDTTYTDADGTEITWEAFDAMADTVFAGMTKKVVTVGWSVYDALADLSQADLIQSFSYSYEAFRGE